MTLLGLAAAPRSGSAACQVTTAVTVDCRADTKTSATTNINGADSSSGARQQRVNNGSDLKGTIRSGVTVSGSGLQLYQSSGANAAVTLKNEGRVTTNEPVDALQLRGNGGPVRYLGEGSIINTNSGKSALSVENSGNVSISTGAGAITGATAISANVTGTGALTITTGAGLVTGTNGEGIEARTADGPLNLTVGSGGVTSTGGNPAIKLRTTNGDITVTANGDVSSHSPGGPHGQPIIHAIQAISTGLGNITVGGSGTIFGQSRGIFAEQSGTGLGGITITGAGDTIAGTRALGCCSPIRAQIYNPQNSSDIVIDRSGNMTANLPNWSLVACRVEGCPNADIHAVTAGTGDIIVAGGVGATFTNMGRYGIIADAYGADSIGSINVSTGANSTLNTAGASLFAVNSAFTIPASAGSTIAVTNNGTLNMAGTGLNTVGINGAEGGEAPTTMPAGIMAGYNGGTVLGTGGTHTACSKYGCITLTPNPNVTGTVSIVNNGAINADGGYGIYAFNFGNGNVSVNSSAPVTVSGATAQAGIYAFTAERGNINITASADVTATNGAGIHTSSAGRGTTTINILAGAVEGATSGVNATSAGRAIRISNSGTIQNISGQPGDAAIALSGGDGTLTNNAGGILTGTVSLTGSGTYNFFNHGVWNTLGTDTFATTSRVTNTGVINVFRPTTFGGLANFNAGGVLNLAAGNAVGTVTMPGSVAFQSGSLYIVALNQASFPTLNVGGTASLAGAVQGVLLPLPFSNETTILHSAGRGGTTFGSFSPPAGFTASLGYTPTDVIVHLNATLGAGATLNANQQNAASALNRTFNSSVTLPGDLAPLFSLTGPNLANGLSQVSGETASDAQLPAFQLANQFINLMLDPFVDGRLGSGSDGGAAMSFAPDAQTILPPEVALAYAGVLKAPPAAPFAQRWTAWAASYGGGNWTNGSGTTGSSNVAAQTYGFAAGMDYHVSPDTIVGFALGGAGTNWGLSSGLGTGRSDAFQSGVYGMTRFGPAYLAGALAFANHWFTTNRTALGDSLTANFIGQSYGGRLEGGYRFGVVPAFLPATIGVTPYAALQAQDFHTPSYSESDLSGGGLGLSYASMNATDVRTELGARFDDPTMAGRMPLVLLGRLAWAHDFVGNPALSAAFQSLPGSTFTVNGAPLPQDSALVSAGAELFITPRWTLLARFDGEFAPGSQTYAGTGTLRYRW